MLSLLDPRRSPASALLLAVAVVVVAAGVGAVLGGLRDTDSAPPPAALVEQRERDRPSFLTRIVPGSRAEGPGAPSPEEIAAGLPLEAEVAQLFLVGASEPLAGDLGAAGIGGVVIERGDRLGASSARALAGRVRRSRPARRVEPLVLARQEGGEFNALAGLAPASAPADLELPSEGARQARSAAAALRRAGVDGVLGPPLDVAPPDGPAVGARAFSDDPGEVAAFARASVFAYRNEGLLVAPGHFPGLGSASQDPELGPTMVGLDVETLAARDLLPFESAVDVGAGAVLISNALYATDDFVVPGSLSRKVVTGLLRARLGFEGLAIADDLTQPAVTALAATPDAALRSLAAGADMVYVGGPSQIAVDSYETVLRAARAGRIPRARIDEAALRVLRAKAARGLIPRPGAR